MSTSLAIAISGSGGAGVISCGELVLRAWARAGGWGMLRKTFGPQIRGGEAAALLSLTSTERYIPPLRCDLLVALDWNNFGRFQDEVRLDQHSVVVCGNDEGPPATVTASGARIIALPLAAMAATAHADGRLNMLVLGLLAAELQLSAAGIAELAAERLKSKPERYRDAARACILAGADAGLGLSLSLPSRPGGENWLVSGNQAAGYGALQAGVRFVAAYPITPASDVLEYLATGLEAVGGQLVQAEDELAAVNMVIGAAFGGVDAFTATSGPGLALMTESLGLAVASETPLTVLNVMRGGPSTGIPTKSEQADLDIALHGLHGDAPHLVLAPLDIADCAFTTGWAVALARHLQVPAIVLSDQFLGQSTAVVAPSALFDPSTLPRIADTVSTDGQYLRYRLSESGISALALPGEPDTRYTADGLEHNQRGVPSASERDHVAQLDKRARKLTGFDPGPYWGSCAGVGPLALVAFGSTSAVIEAAREQLAERAIDCRAISLRMLAPLPMAQLSAALAGCERVIVVEQNHSRQLWRYLRSLLDEEPRLSSFARPGPVPLDPASVVAAVMEGMDNE